MTEPRTEVYVEFGDYNRKPLVPTEEHPANAYFSQDTEHDDIHWPHRVVVIFESCLGVVSIGDTRNTRTKKTTAGQRRSLRTSKWLNALLDVRHPDCGATLIHRSVKVALFNDTRLCERY